MIISVVIKESSLKRAYTNSQSNLEIDFFCNSAYHFLKRENLTFKCIYILAFINNCVTLFTEPGGDSRDRAVYLDIKHGAEMKDYDAIAKAEKLKPLEKELRKLEDLSESIVNDFAYMRSREEEMRDTNG